MTSPVQLCAAGATEFPPACDPLALARNENPFPPLPSVRTAIVEATAAINRYPELFPCQLRALIAGQTRLSEDQVIIGAGATGVVLEVLRALTRPGERIVMGSPTFDGYPIFSEIAGLVPVEVPLDASGYHDLDAMAEASDGARVVAVCRPHNPTGTVNDERDIRRFLRRIAADTVVLLDEAYVEFISPALWLDVPALIADFPNVVVVRTFSKAYGLAALRVGYGVCVPAVARQIWASHPPFGTSFLGLAAVAASFGARDELQRRIAAITTERSYLRMQLGGLGLTTTESHANFVFLPDRGRSWHAIFDAAGVRVRAVGNHGVRITVGDRSSTSAVLAAVKTALTAAQ